jgi:predicted TIM-barrel fold metal-dependent hydrolase
MPTCIVDAHHHLWDLRANYYPWLADQPEANFFLGDYAPLKRNYMPADYRADAAALPVVKTVHCEAEWDRNDQVGETRWLCDVHARFGMPHAVVAHAWFHTDNAASVLEAQSQFQLVRGIRSKPVTSLRPDESVDGQAGTMGDPRWREGFARLADYGFSWDLRVPYWHLHEAAELVAQYPQIPVVLNHTGFPWDRTERGLAAWRDAMQAIAQCAHVSLKVSEFGLRDASWDYDSNARVVHHAIDIFGIERCMFASNFPVARLRVDYHTLVSSLERMLCGLTQDALQAFFHDNAARFYRL